MKAFVTGANGFTGSHLVKALERQNIEVTALVRPTSNLERLQGTQAQLVYGDITDRSALEKGMQAADWVFHTAAYVELGIVDAALMEKVNVEGTRAVLTVASEAKIQKMVYCSTIGVFGDTRGQVVDESYQRTQTDFSSPYDRTKYRAQQLVDEWAAYGLPVVSVMPSGIFGIDDPHFRPIIERFLQGGLKVWAQSDRLTGIVHVDDLVDAMLLAAQKAPPGEWYILSAGEMTAREMFALIGEDAGIAPPVEVPKPLVLLVGNILEVVGRLFSWNPPLSRERLHYVYDRLVRVDGNKARRELGWQPRSPETVLLEMTAQIRQEWP
ncbi:NAD-dependent epimerase/dehydratase family protein [Geitlerinema sp. PCC 9228]|jgi:nucleoside-diphosphate-sugar epimerase|uniref:NAD-dependent epimerase/dehydratase family protein n=1 Tax=Geitlerinema sp. PCC 9228 TaxID=111611 RepID=UPI0008F99FEA|nr:NAD-dependent epimerase/dehydratase family protein [Geitlerinema sp. PCC 9228]